MNKGRSGRKEFEKLDFEAESEHWFEIYFHIDYINLIFVKIEFWCLCGYLFKEH